MSVSDILLNTYRSAGYYEGGLVETITAGQGAVNTNGRDYERAGVELNPYDSNSAGTDQLFLVAESSLPQAFGHWPFIV